ncbi:mechanosensitive ion channel family protein [Demequina oxidasica]|uniref:mechanosensitive ion channel family protein n=1 Tax=Demequina oxidasica TaxID=676199 RepID=UPI0007806C8C|nr:mechanosensitive ion channel family protein [Demequina oxidasica]
MLIFDATPSATSSAESTPGDDQLNAIQTFLHEAANATVNFAATVVVVFILWLIARRVVKGVTRSIEEGTPLNNRKARKALAKARIKIPDIDSTDARLEAERRRQRAGTIRAVLNSTITILAVVVVAVSLLSVLGIPVGPLVASAGIAGVALGFGAQSLVKDVLSGVFMLLEDQYGVGDIVDVGEAIGTVEEVGLRSTRLRSIDGTVWYVPNGEIRRVGNMTRLWSRVMIEVRFSYDTDIDAAREAMLDAVASARSDEEIDQAILSEPEVPGIESFEFNAFMLRLMVQVNPATQWDVQRAIRRQMRAIFARRGLRLAVPDQAMIFDNDSKAAIGQDVLADEYAAIDDAEAAAAEKVARSATDPTVSDTPALPKPQGDRPGASGRNMPAGDEGGDE